MKQTTLKIMIAIKTPKKLPENPYSPLFINTILDELSSALQKNGDNKHIGHLILKPNSISIDVWKKLIPYSPSNIGNWSTLENKPAHFTTAFEADLILKLLDLYKASADSVEGYMTSGATEGNIFASWLGRKYLEEQGINKICLINNSLTHYSVTKAADIVGVKSFLSSLDSNSWTHSPISIIETMKSLTKQGFQGFIIPLTIGYTIGGTEDPIKEIISAIQGFIEKNKRIKVYIWIDAAISGLLKPFLDRKFAPFGNLHIQAFVTDFHKMLGVPFPAGVVLYKKELRKLIEKPIPYLPFTDTTLLGSRTGISAVSAWATLHRYGLKSIRTSITRTIAEKRNFIELTEKLYKISRVISASDSTHGAFIRKKSLPEAFCRKFGLRELQYSLQFEKKTETFLLYPFYFSPIFESQE